MALTCGFFDSENHDRQYHASDFNSMFDGIITDGVFKTYGEGLIVKPYKDYTVLVSKGKAWFNHTWSVNDADEHITISNPHSMKDRIDAIVLEVDGAARNNRLSILEGEPSTEPQKPTPRRSTNFNQYVLAYVHVYSIDSPKYVGYITESAIENAVGTAETPWSSALVETIEADTIMTQWKAQLDEFIAERQNTYNESLAEWYTVNDKAFKDWFQTLQTMLDGDIAQKLATEMITKQEKHQAKTIVLPTDNSKWTSLIVDMATEYHTDILMVEGVTADNIVQVAPDPTSFSEYGLRQIRAIEQSYNGLVFAAKEIPTKAVTVNVLIWN